MWHSHSAAIMTKTPAPNTINAQSQQGEKSAFSYQTFDLDQSPSVDDSCRSTYAKKARRRRHLWPLFPLLALILVLGRLLTIFLQITTAQQNPPMPLPSVGPSTSTNPRETVIDLQSGSVTGSYSLYDLLSIHTASGHIDITISLHNASTDDPQKPAVLRLSTASGSIRVRISPLSSSSSSSSSRSSSPAKIPDREYETELSSRSGSLDAVLVHGTHTSLKTNSGSIVASLSPYGAAANSTRSEISTSSNSGHTEVTVHPLLGDAAAPLRQLYADYRHGSGGLVLSYPSTWEGTAQGTTASGGIDVHWEGLRVVRDRKGGVSREFEAVKGDGDGVLRFKGSSGHVELSGDSDYWARQQQQGGGGGSKVVADEPPPPYEP